MVCHFAMSTYGIWTCTISTKTANAPKTKKIRFRISGTTRALARLRQIVIDGQSFLKSGAGGFELRPSRRRKSDVAERQPFGRVARREDLHAVLAFGDKSRFDERLRADDILGVPVLEIA